MRYGTRTHCKRRWSRQGRRPLCRVKLGYEWGYLYVAICPFSADLFAMFFSHLDKACFAHFLEQFQLHLKKKELTKVLLIGDGAWAHSSQDWQQWQVAWQQLPTACPELNPVERFFEELRRHTSNQVCSSKQQVELRLEKLINQFLNIPEKIRNITLFPYINQCA